MGRFATVMLSGVLAAIASPGCTTTAELEQSRFASFTGLKMSEFMQVTLVTPRDFYEQDGQRVFVAERGSCAMHITTRATGYGKGADAWTITTISRRGGCAGI